MRLIAGALGGRRLVAPRGTETRPTSDRVREAIFSIVEPVAGQAVLDLYAGSGAMAFEALSRGAERAVMVECGRAALVALKRNIDSLGLADRSELLGARVERVLPQIARQGPFDLVIVDPPYVDVGSGRVKSVLERLLSRADSLTPSARLILEHAHRDAPPELAGMVLHKTRRYGDTAVSDYRR